MKSMFPLKLAFTVRVISLLFLDSKPCCLFKYLYISNFLYGMRFNGTENLDFGDMSNLVTE